LLILETGARPGEAAELRWTEVHLQPAIRAKFGDIRILKGKTKNAKRNLSLSARAGGMLKARKLVTKSAWVFPGDTPDAPILVTSLDHQHEKVRAFLQQPEDFVVHSLRHTMLTRLGQSGAGAFTIMKITGQASVTTSQKYVHPTPEDLERAFERMGDLNTVKQEEAADGTAAEEKDGWTGPKHPLQFPLQSKSRVPRNRRKLLK
jgi:integrase